MKLNIRKLRKTVSEGGHILLIVQGALIMSSASPTLGGSIPTPLGSWMCLFCVYADTYEQRP
jgi:hypothetical protein